MYIICICVKVSGTFLWMYIWFETKGALKIHVYAWVLSGLLDRYIYLWLMNAMYVQLWNITAPQTIYARTPENATNSGGYLSWINNIKEKDTILHLFWIFFLVLGYSVTTNCFVFIVNKIESALIRIFLKAPDTSLRCSLH